MPSSVFDQIRFRASRARRILAATNREWIKCAPEVRALIDLVESRMHRPASHARSLKERLYSIADYVSRAYFVPTDGPGYVSPRPPSHVYQLVLERVMAAESEQNGHWQTIKPYFFHKNLSRIPHESSDPACPIWNNNWFSSVDARLLYATIAAYRPAKIVEIGSGNSTRFARQAIKDFGLQTELVCVDPQPRVGIESVADRIHRASLLDVQGDEFSRLQRNDILFLDGSHLVANGTDCTRFFLEILPEIPAGVFIHVHDIHLPFEYSEGMSKMFFAEQYLLASALIYNSDLVPLFPVWYFLTQNRFPEIGEIESPVGQSFWIQRRV